MGGVTCVQGCGPNALPAKDFPRALSFPWVPGDPAWLPRSVTLCTESAHGPPRRTDLVPKVDLCCGRNRLATVRARFRGAGPLTKQTRSWPVTLRSGAVVSRRRGWRVSQVRTRNLLGLDRRSPGRPGSPWTLPAPAASTPPRSGSHRNDITPPDNPSAWGLSPRPPADNPTRARISGPPSRRAVRRAGVRTPCRNLGHLTTCPRPRHLVPAPCSCPKSPPDDCTFNLLKVPHAARPTPPPALHRPPQTAVRRRLAAAGGGWRRLAAAGGGCGGWRSARVVHQSSVAAAAGSRSLIGARRQAGTTHGYDRRADSPCARRGSRRSRQV